TYFENVCTTTQEKRKVTQYTCVPTQVQVQVPCWTTVMVPECIPPSCCNPCGGVRYRCERVCTMQTVTRTVLQQVPQEVEVLVNVPVWNKVERKGKRLVCSSVPEESVIEVPVCTYTTQERVGKRLVCSSVPEESVIEVPVCTYTTQERVGKRLVCNSVPVEREVVVNVCTMTQEK